MNVIFKIIGVVFNVFGMFSKSKEDRKRDKQIRQDQKVADAIRDGDGQRVAEEWKKRKDY